MMQDCEDSSNVSALIEAAKNGDIHGVLGLIEGVGVEVDACVAQYRRTALHWACERGHMELCETLIGHQADVNFTDRNGATPLHWAAWNGHPEVVKLLLSKGADKYLEDKDCETALQGASDEPTRDALVTPRSTRSAPKPADDGQGSWQGTRGRIHNTVKTLVDETVRLHGMVEKLVAQNGRLLHNQKALVAEVLRLKGLVDSPADDDVLLKLGLAGDAAQ